jgi:hypothetical protein
MTEASLPTIVSNYVREDEKGENVFDFERIVPIGDVSDWYHQRLEKWGTKWIGYDLNIGGSCMDFYTAWSPPIPIIVKLAELHKDLIFRLEYSEPGAGFAGMAVAQWQNGEVLLDNDCHDFIEEVPLEVEFA